MRQLSNFSLAVGLDVLHGQLGGKESNSVLSAVRETRRNIQVGQSIGENKQVLDHVADDGEEAELTARLEEIRERRSGSAAACRR